MIDFFANLFGYFLNFLYTQLGSFGLAIIVFSIIIKLVTLPMTIKQQKTMKKTAKVQEKLREIQDKYKNNPDKLQQETMDLYKREDMSPFSGCFSVIFQFILLISVFYLVRSPLTYMKKVDVGLIQEYKNQLETENSTNQAYPEISIIKNKGNKDERVYINMDFCGLDLSGIPMQDRSNINVFIIPTLYVLTTFISMKINNNIANTKNNKAKMITDGTNKELEVKAEETNPVEDANKSMSYMMPLLSISIALVAPLGLALYWLVNNILMIVERLALNKLIKEEE